MTHAWIDVHAEHARTMDRINAQVAERMARDARERGEREARARAERFKAGIERGDAAVMREFFEDLCATHRIAIEYSADEQWYAHVGRRNVRVPPPIDRDALAVCLHEAAHVLGPNCSGGAHARARHGCLECERLAWVTACAWVPFDRDMHKRLRDSLRTYREDLPAPAAARNAADRLMGTATWAREYQQRFMRRWREEQQARVMREVREDADRESRRLFQQVMAHRMTSAEGDGIQ